MYLVSPFRRLAFTASQSPRILPVRMATEARRPHHEGPVEPQDQSSLTCRWEVGEEQTVQLGDQTFRSGTMFMHWMPVH